MVNHVFTIDTHVQGGPLRTIMSGIPFLIGSNIEEKRDYFKKHFDHIRKAIILEPRGHDNMFGAVLCEPTKENADLSVFFMHNDGYLDMCGHGVIGVVKTYLETNSMNKEIENEIEINLETPAGLIHAIAHINKGSVKNVVFRNVPSFVVYRDKAITLPDFGSVLIDIAYGGNYFGLIDVEQLSLRINKDNIPQFISMGMHLIDLLNKYNDINYNKVELIEFYESDSVNQKMHKNCVVFGNNQVDRSPCGSGTSAMLALKHEKNEIEINSVFINESVIGTKFEGKIVEVISVDNVQAVVTEIKGIAYITGYHHFVIDQEDLLSEGFSVNAV